VTQTTPNPAPITFTRGETFANVNFGNFFGTATAAATQVSASKASASIPADGGTAAGLATWDVTTLVKALDPAL
jgi:hypothetical protein